MNGRSAGGLVLLLVGSIGLIGYLTGNLDRWLAALFTPPAPAKATGMSSLEAAPMTVPPGGNQRGAYLS
jgi:hypothetical protein